MRCDRKPIHVCAAANCTNELIARKLSFFRFPRDPERACTWAAFSGRIDLIKQIPNVRRHRLCADHFESKMFYTAAKNRLQRNAVPTLFNGAHKRNAACVDHNYSLHTPMNVENVNELRKLLLSQSLATKRVYIEHSYSLASLPIKTEDESNEEDESDNQLCNYIQLLEIELSKEKSKPKEKAKENNADSNSSVLLRTEKQWEEAFGDSIDVHVIKLEPNFSFVS